MRVLTKKVFVKQLIAVILMTILMSTFFIVTNLQVFAAPDINSINGGGQSQSSYINGGGNKNNYDTKNATDGLKQAFDSASVDSQDLAEASRFASPFVHAVKFIIAVITACFSVLLGLVTILDLLYLAVPPIRNFLNKEQPQQSAGGGMGMGGMGMGGMGMGRMGGMGGGAAQPSQTGLGRFVSDEAVAALAEATQQAGGGATGGMGGMGMGMGGMGMGGMGMGGMGGQAQVQPKTKSVILLYLKKRVVAITLFFVCLALFTSTLFTDRGLWIGQWIIDIVGNLF